VQQCVRSVIMMCRRWWQLVEAEGCCLASLLVGRNSRWQESVVGQLTVAELLHSRRCSSCGQLAGWVGGWVGGHCRVRQRACLCMQCGGVLPLVAVGWLRQGKCSSALLLVGCNSRWQESAVGQHAEGVYAV
jgi:hypothetical protein